MNTTASHVNALRQAYARLASLPAGCEPRRDAAAALAKASRAALDWMNLAFEAFSAERFGEGHAALAETRAADPDFLPARWLAFQYPDDPAPASPAAAERFIARWADGIAEFERLDFREPRWQAQVWGCVGSCTAFYRHYLGDDLALYTRYGRLVQRMMAALDPGDPPRPLRSGRRRVVFCSPHLFEHTVARLFVPLIEAQDRQRFDLHCVSFASGEGEWLGRLQRVAQVHAGLRAPPDWRRLLSQLQADVIVYLDVGMDPITQGLAALRLAPCQAVMWGHPVTTGLPSVDYFLSPDAMEGADGESHYSEALWRLPGLGHGLDPAPAPSSPPPAAADAPLDLLCAQSVYKLMPEQDALFARILARLPGARLHLIPHPEASVREWLLARMRPALAAAGVSPERVVLHGYRPLAEFRALATGCALNLDSIGWSGGMSSLDLLQLGLPTVTLPGNSMRSRQTAALLQRLDAGDGIAGDREDYVERAVALASDPVRRQALGQCLRDNASRLFERERVAAGLGEFLGHGSITAHRR